MIATIIIVLIALIWLAYESDWMTVRLQPGAPSAKVAFNLIDKVKEVTPGRILTGTLVVLLLAALGVLGYILFTPAQKDSFTEFYILGLGGKAADYPKEISLGDEGNLIVGIVNRENKSMSYLVKIAIDGKANKEIGAIALANGEKWEGEVAFKPTQAGDNQEVQFFLYEEGGSAPKQELHLWVNVKEGK